MEMGAATAAAARERGFRVVSEISLPPGRYQLRASASEEGANRSGSVFYDVEVPDFYKVPFAMSGIALTSAAMAATPSVRPSETLRDVLPGPLAAGREFPANDQIGLFVEFYENMPNAPAHTIQLSTTVRSEDGRVVFENREQRSSSDLQGKAGGYGYGVRIPLTEFAPGLYVIRVEGRSINNASAAREMLIRVR
jgi:hypothetical protein